MHLKYQGLSIFHGLSHPPIPQALSHPTQLITCRLLVFPPRIEEWSYSRTHVGFRSVENGGADTAIYADSLFWELSSVHIPWSRSWAVFQEAPIRGGQVCEYAFGCRTVGDKEWECLPHHTCPMAISAPGFGNHGWRGQAITWMKAA